MRDLWASSLPGSVLSEKSCPEVYVFVLANPVKVFVPRLVRCDTDKSFRARIEFRSEFLVRNSLRKSLQFIHVMLKMNVPDEVRDRQKSAEGEHFSAIHLYERHLSTKRAYEKAQRCKMSLRFDKRQKGSS